MKLVAFITSKPIFVTRFSEYDRFDRTPNGASFLTLNHTGITQGETLHTLKTIFHYMAT